MKAVIIAVAVCSVVVAGALGVLGFLVVNSLDSTDFDKYFFRVELQTPGGPLPFDLYVNDHESSIGQLMIGSEIIRIEREDIAFVALNNGSGSTRAMVSFPYYDSLLDMSGASSSTMTGTWTKHRGINDDGSPKIATMQATAQANDGNSSWFEPIEPAGLPAEFAGRWSVKFSSSDDLAVGEFTVNDDRTATGTFLTTTGDYRYLYGQVDGDLMRLSTFDGAHAFLFHARMQDDGSVAGDFWSGNWWHETWTATRDAQAQLPDAFTQTTLAEGIDLSELSFTDMNGNSVRLADALDAQGGKARIVELFGTWCPNCADAAKEIRRLKAKHADNLSVVALAFELTDDHARSVQQINRYKERHGLDGTTDWPILIAGVSDKAKATESVRLLDKVRSYPTTLFLNADNEVVAIHTGFTGPATGDAFTTQQAQWEAIIDGLLED